MHLKFPVCRCCRHQGALLRLSPRSTRNACWPHCCLRRAWPVASIYVAFIHVQALQALAGSDASERPCVVLPRQSKRSKQKRSRQKPRPPSPCVYGSRAPHALPSCSVRPVLGLQRLGTYSASHCQACTDSILSMKAMRDMRMLNRLHCHSADCAAVSTRWRLHSCVTIFKIHHAQYRHAFWLCRTQQACCPSHAGFSCASSREAHALFQFQSESGFKKQKGRALSARLQFFSGVNSNEAQA